MMRSFKQVKLHLEVNRRQLRLYVPTNPLGFAWDEWLKRTYSFLIIDRFGQRSINIHMNHHYLDITYCVSHKLNVAREDIVYG